MHIARFDDRKILDTIIWELMTTGEALDDLDVRLSLVAPVDLDLLGQCVAEAAQSWAEMTQPAAVAA